MPLCLVSGFDLGQISELIIVRECTKFDLMALEFFFNTNNNNNNFFSRVNLIVILNLHRVIDHNIINTYL